MRLAVDANVLIGALLRTGGRRLLAHPALELVTAEHVWEEFQHELPRRAARFAAERGIGTAAMEALVLRVLATAATVVLVLPREAYEPLEEDARRRSDRDPADWPTIATALLVGGAIWTEDRDFFGCGIATWRTAVLDTVLL